MECGDGYTRADNGNIGPIVAKTAAHTIKAGDAARAYSNRGATGSVTFTLPAAGDVDGTLRTFFKATPAQSIVLQATGGAKINGGTANKAYQNVTSETGVCTIFSDGTDWFIRAEKGTWANNNT